MAAQHTRIDTGLGELTLVSDGQALTGLYFPHHWYPPKPDQLGPLVDAVTDPLFAAVAAQLDEFLAGKRTEFAVPVRTRGDQFQEQVWALLAQTRTAAPPPTVRWPSSSGTGPSPSGSVRPSATIR